MSNIIDIKNFISTYGTHTLKMKCSSTGYTDSDYTEQVIDYQPRISIDVANEIIIFSHVLPSVTEYKIYGETTLLGTFTTGQASADNINISCSDLGISLDDYEYYCLTTTINNQTYTTGNVWVSKIYGVSGLYDSSSSLTRTDDAVGMSFAINSSTGEISSDFDLVFPFDHITKVTIGANTFVKIPAMWFRVGIDSNNRITDIAVSKSRGDTGNWYHTEEFYYGAYLSKITNNVAYSKTNETPSSSIGLNNLRTYTAANGSKYCELDIYHLTILRFLFMIEYATKDSVSVMTGRNDTGSFGVTGNTDSLTTPSGWNTTTLQMRYHYIEDFYGNGLEHFDGIYRNTASINTDKSDAASYMDISYNFSIMGGSITALGWDPNNPFICMPCEIGGTYTTYFCDGYSNNGGTTITACVFGIDPKYYSTLEGLFYTETSSTLSWTFNTFTSRMIYCPNN